jgi:hypothetical protein
MRAVNDTFTKSTIELDGGEFIDSTFADCKLVYHGGALPKIEQVKLEDSLFALRGSAANTIDFLKLLCRLVRKTQWNLSWPTSKAHKGGCRHEHIRGE